MITATPNTDADVRLADDLFASSWCLRRQSRRIAGEPFATLTAAQLDVVRLLRRTPGVSVAEAAAELGLAPNTVSTLVGQLCTAGVVRRSCDAGDRRVARLELTTAARDRLDGWIDRRGAIAARAIAALTPRERQLLTDAIPVIARFAAELPAAASRTTEDHAWTT